MMVHYVFKFTDKNLVNETAKAWGLAFRPDPSNIWYLPKSKCYFEENYFEPGLHGIFVPPWLVKTIVEPDEIEFLLAQNYFKKVPREKK